MKTVGEINEEIKFNTELTDLLEAMKSISVFHFRALQAKKKRFPRLAEEMEGFFDMLKREKIKHPFINPKNPKSAVIIITSDEGFMGGLNLQVTDAALAGTGPRPAHIFVVGEKGARYLADMGKKDCTVFRSAASFEDRYKLAVELKEDICQGQKKGKFGKVLAYYPKPVSFITQKVEAMQLLPLAPVIPATPVIPAQAGIRAGDIIIESPISGIIDYLAEVDVVYKLIDVLEDSKLSEFASRAIHLEGSTRGLKDKEKGLKFQYFRAYHELIDKNTRELFSAQVIGKK